MTIFGIPQGNATFFSQNLPSFLTKGELDEYKAIASNKKSDWIAGRIAIKLAYQSVHPKRLELNKIKVCHSKNGQPYVFRDAKRFCSISHSFSCGIGAVAPYPIGIDIEKIKPRKKELLKFVAIESEIALLGKGNKKQVEFLTKLWTIKEAVMKAIGTGFLVKPKDLIVYKKEKNVFLVRVLENKYANSSLWKVRTIKHRDFYVSIAFPWNAKNYEKIINWVNKFSISAAE